MLGKLAQVQWQLGQTLLPDHFETQETALLTDCSVKFSLLGKPFYGLIELEFDLSALVKDIIRIKAFSCILESGELIKVGGNARFMDDKDQLELPKASLNVDLYLNIYQAVFAPTLADSTDGQNPIPRKGYRLDFISVPGIAESEQVQPQLGNSLIERFKLASFVRAKDKNWLLDDRFLPPLVVLDKSPLFKQRRETLEVYLKSFRQELEKSFLIPLLVEQPSIASNADNEESIDEFVRPRNSVSASNNSEFQSGLIGLLDVIYATQRMLDRIKQADGEILTHPFDLFSQLQKFYVACKLYRNSLPGDLNVAYRHQSLASVFDWIIGLLDQVIFLKAYTYSQCALREKNGVYACEVKANQNEINKTYYLCIFHESSVMSGNCPPPEKISSVERVRKLEEYSFDGVKLVPLMDHAAIDRLNEDRPSNRSSQYYLVEQSDEWDEVMASGSFAFYGQAEYRGYFFELIVETKNYEARA